MTAGTWHPPERCREMFPGLVGDLVETYGPHTEADGVAIAAHFVVGFGSALGAGPHFYVGETRHCLNEFLLIVGPTGRTRKGDSKEIAFRVLRDADPDWAGNIASGLSSGEGLIYCVRDATEKLSTAAKNKGEIIISDGGVDDKRLLVVETEFAGPLKVLARDGNTLSCVLRDSWDHKTPLRTLTRNSPLRSTDAHVSIIAHCTPADLAAYLGETEVANGFANRFMMVQVARAQILPSPSRPPDAEVQTLVRRVRDALEYGRSMTELRRTPTAERVWQAVYPDLTTDQPGLAGALLARAEAHVARLSALFTLFSLKREIDTNHLRSALAWWKYIEESTRNIFQDRSGDEKADRILQELLPEVTMSVSEIREQIFANHVSALRLQSALSLLLSLGEISVERESTGGRPRILVTRLDRKKSEKSAESPEVAEVVA
jgi:hypothetical protein